MYRQIEVTPGAVPVEGLWPNRRLVWIEDGADLVRGRVLQIADDGAWTIVRVYRSTFPAPVSDRQPLWRRA